MCRLNEKYKKEVIEKRKRNQKCQKERSRYLHNHLLEHAGPVWYQELSPKQKDILDHLKCDMKEDLHKHVTKHTQSKLSRLGLIPLPGDNTMWKALTNSYGCPIEFLLLIYRYTSRNKNAYTLNDRLVLSGVVHLTLKDTLKEMHIRFPSPPREPVKEKPREKRKQQRKSPNPYLAPFFFNWRTVKINRYVPKCQKPTCPYFSYLQEMPKPRVKRQLNKDWVIRVDKGVRNPCFLCNDHKNAEKEYNSMYPCDTRYTLLRPTLYQRSAPVVYPGILPKFMLDPDYVVTWKLHVDEKVQSRPEERVVHSEFLRRKSMQRIPDPSLDPFEQSCECSEDPVDDSAAQRFVLLKKIPKKRTKQMEILEKLLEGLAQDGYPLARLPDVHRVPYFWLWMQFRSCRCWDRHDAVKCLDACEELWRHIASCKRRLPTVGVPYLGLPERKEYTWGQVEQYVAAIQKMVDNYYDAMKRNVVNFHREFFVSLGLYQFAQSPYMHNFVFAYGGGKMEDVNVRYPWLVTEKKDPLERVSCVC